VSELRAHGDSGLTDLSSADRERLRTFSNRPLNLNELAIGSILEIGSTPYSAL
jgi:hypothetical protein